MESVVRVRPLAVLVILAPLAPMLEETPDLLTVKRTGPALKDLRKRRPMEFSFQVSSLLKRAWIFVFTKNSADDPPANADDQTLDADATHFVAEENERVKVRVDGAQLDAVRINIDPL